VRSGLEWEEDAVGLGIDGNRVAVVARVLVVDGDEAGLSDVEYDEIAALRGDVDPPEIGIDAHHVGTGAARRGDDRVRTLEIDARDAIVDLARDDRARAVGMESEP